MMKIAQFTLLLCATSSVSAQGVDYIKSHYTKYEHYIPMRDGVRLFTAVYAPKDDAKTWPVLMVRTPYSVRPYGPDKYPANLGPSEIAAKAGYIFVNQDVRGRFMSEGTFEQVRPHNTKLSESTDTYDTIEWLLKHVPNHNGKVGMYGISYPGFYVSAGMIDAHPALVAVSPQAPVGDWFIGDDFHHNGAFYLVHALRWFSANSRAMLNPTTGPTTPQAVDYRTPDGYKFYLDMGPLANFEEKELKGSVPFWTDMMRHGTYDDFWKARNIRPHLKNIKPAVLNVGGWFDAEDLFGTLETYKWTERNSPGAYNVLVMGPWYHGQWARDEGAKLGPVEFNAKTGEFYREKIELPFFEHFLKGKPDPKLPEAYAFETGSNRWVRHNAWPPKEAAAKTIYLQPGGKLAFEAAKSAGFDEYLSDPAKPVPYTGYIAANMTREHMLDDQRHAARRPDVLAFESAVLESDVVAAGPVRPVIYVSTTGTDSDFVVKLIDVNEDDFQQLVRGEVFRGKFRNSFEKPEPFVPGEVAKIDYVMPDVNHNFRRGHRIMIQIQSTWFPLVDRNPQKFMDIYSARREDFQKATQHIFYGGRYNSGVTIQVMGYN